MTGSDEGLPIIDPADIRTPRETGDVRIAGVLLAAGESNRFGQENKLCVELNGMPVVRHSANVLASADLSPRIAVVGHEENRITEAISSLNYQVVSNSEYSKGQSTSVATGVSALPDVDAAVFALGDMPAIRPRTIDALIDTYVAGAGTVVAAAYDGKRGNPVLFDASHFSALIDVNGDIGGRHLLSTTDRSILVETGDPGVRLDIDTEADVTRLQAFMAEQG